MGFASSAGKMGLRRNSRIYCLSLLVAGIGTGCGLFKAGNAINPNATAVGQFASFIQPASNVTRSSGDATYIRLQALFPSQMQSKINYLNPINYDPPGNLGQLGSSETLGSSRVNAPEELGGAIYEFNPMTSTGSLGGLGSTARPFTISGQSALGEYTSQLCSQDTDLNLYSTTGILMPGESMPSDPSTALAFTIVRNAWLYPYAADSPEVLALAQFYQNALSLEQTLGGSNSSSSGSTPSTQQITSAQQALCLVALGSSQFWMGSGQKGDVIRRLALELGRRVPTFAEYADYLSGTMTVDQYTQKLEGEPGYAQAVMGWHQQSLDLFLLDSQMLYGDTGMWPQSPYATGGASGTYGANFEYVLREYLASQQLSPVSRRARSDSIRLFERIQSLQRRVLLAGSDATGPAV